jgi:hypothetical protein
VLPLLTAVVQKPAWSEKWKKVVAVAAALLAGVVTVAADGGWEQFRNQHLAAATLFGVLVASQTSYDLFWKPTQLAPMIESLTAKKAPQQAE